MNLHKNKLLNMLYKTVVLKILKILKNLKSNIFLIKIIYKNKKSKIVCKTNHQ